MISFDVSDIKNDILIDDNTNLVQKPKKHTNLHDYWHISKLAENGQKNDARESILSAF